MATTLIDTRWTGSDNLFWNPMTNGIVDSVEIAFAYYVILDTNKTHGAIQLQMFDDFAPRYNNLEAKSGIKGSDLMSKEGLTGVVVDNFDLIQAKLTRYQNMTIQAGADYGRGTFNFGQIWGQNLNRFYRGSRTAKEAAFLSVTVAMAAYPPLASLALEIKSFHDFELKGAVHNQQSKMTIVTGDQTGILDAQMDCARGMDKGLGWGKLLYADQPVVEDRIRLINALFPLSLIKKHKNLEHIGMVAAGAYKEIVLHGFKAGEKVKIYVDGTEDLLFWLMPTSKLPCPPTALRVKAGMTVEDLATILGDLTNRHVMVTNTSLVNPSHYEFTIIEA